MNIFAIHRILAFCPERKSPVEQKKIEYHRRIQHIRITRSTKFHLKMSVLVQNRTP